MKSAVLGILVLFVGTVALASLSGSCAINHKSGDYACTITADCNDGRQCVDGFCIVPGSIDAAVFRDAHVGGDGNGCPAGCTSCNVTTHSCTIDCSQNSGGCNNKVTCPAGWACNVQCNVDNSCRNGVSCTGTTSCDITCSAKSSCQNIQCGTGKCNVTCSGVQSCQAVACGNSCACDVTCLGSQSCADTIQCTATACKLGLGCTSLPAACHSC